MYLTFQLNKLLLEIWACCFNEIYCYKSTILTLFLLESWSFSAGYAILMLFLQRSWSFSAVWAVKILFSTLFLCNLFLFQSVYFPVCLCYAICLFMQSVRDLGICVGMITILLWWSIGSWKEGRPLVILFISVMLFHVAAMLCYTLIYHLYCYVGYCYCYAMLCYWSVML